MKKITALAALLAIPAMAAPAGYFQVPGTETTMKIYGKAETWAYYNLQTSDNDLADPHDQTTMEKNTTDSWTVGRIGVTTTTPSSYGDVNVKVEFEAKTVGGGTNSYGNPWRMRHMYGEFHGLLIGQTTSLFNAWHNVPNYNDTWYGDFDGTSRVRQIRYSFAPADGFQLGFSMENDKTGGDSTKFGPAFVAAGTYGADWGAVTASVGYQKIRDWSKTGTVETKKTGSVTSFAISGLWNITENDSLTVNLQDGLGQHGNSFADGWYDAGSKYKAYKNRYMGIAYGHNWGNGFDSNIGIGQTTAPKKVSYGVDEKIVRNELFVNTNWQVTKNVKWGAEYYMNEIKFKSKVVTTEDGPNESKKMKNSNINMFFQYNFF